MTLIQSGASSDLATVDPGSKALRATLYKSNGAELDFDGSAATGSYGVVVDVVPTTLTDGTVYWTLLNNGTKEVWLKCFELTMGFSGTAAATRSALSISRFSNATPSGGTSAVPVKHDPAFPASSVGDVRFAPAGLTLSGVVFEAPFCLLAVPNQLNANFSFPINPPGAIVIEPNQGIAVRAVGAVVLGLFLAGSVHWAEYTP